MIKYNSLTVYLFFSLLITTLFLYYYKFIVSGTLTSVLFVLLIISKILLKSDKNHIYYLTCYTQEIAEYYLYNKDKVDIEILKDRLKRLEKFSLVNLTVMVSAIITGLKFIVFDYFSKNNTYMTEINSGYLYKSHFIDIIYLDFLWSSLVIIVFAIYVYVLKEIIVSNFKRVFIKKEINY